MNTPKHEYPVNGGSYVVCKETGELTVAKPSTKPGTQPADPTPTLSATQAAQEKKR